MKGEQSLNYDALAKIDAAPQVDILSILLRAALEQELGSSRLQLPIGHE